MTAAHNTTISRLLRQLYRQVDERVFDIRSNDGHVRRSAEHYYVPDVCVIPLDLLRPQLDSRALEVYDAPLPLVVEVWSPSTGAYDVETKLVEYQRRGDLEIWRVHPYERTLTSWVLQPDGRYIETVYRTGTVQPTALPGVIIDLEALFG